MTQTRNLKLDLCALGLLALVIILALALLTYSPSDPIDELVAPLDRLYHGDTLVYPGNQVVGNACGRWGALVASMLFTGLGLGAYYLVGSMAALDVLLLWRRDIDAPFVRAAGWAASLVGITAVLTLVAPAWSPGPVIGSGGYLGALSAGLMQLQFATVGSLILAASLILGGLLMCTDYALLRISAWVFGVAVASVTGGRQFLPRRARDGDDRAAEAEDEDDDDEVEEPATALSVRIGGKAVEEEEEEEEEEEDGEDQDEGEDDEEAEEEGEEEEVEPEIAVRGKARRLKADQETSTSAPRVRRRQNKSERLAVMQSLDEASLNTEAEDYELPPLDLLIESDDVCFEAQAKEVRRKAKILERTFANFGFNVKVVEIETGPVIAQYEVELEAGLRLSRITGLADDLAIALRVPSVRIVAPIPGKNTVGIEVPNEARQVVRLREVMAETNGKMKKMRIPLFIGKDVSGNPLTVDLSTLPHLLIAGRTGTGKSVCLNAIISSILMTRRPDEVRMLMIDPKMVELSCYGRLPHLMHPVVTDMRKAEAILAWAVEKMEERYALLARAGVRHVTSYNQLGKEELVERLAPETDEQREAIPDHLPFIVIVADEIADLMMTAGKEVEQHIIRLAQKSRAVGIHLILATQKPTVDVITGLIKSNLPARISFQVASRTDSRVVLDEMGAEKLLGSGDMLFLWPGTSMLLRGQGTYLTDDEINAVVDTVSTGEQNFVNELVNMKVEKPDDEHSPETLRKRDELYESAIDVIVREGRGSVSLLQRTLGIGYGRAARLIDFMAEDGIVGDYNGSQAREVLLSAAEWEQMQGLEAEPEAPQPAPLKHRRSNVIRREGNDWEEEVATSGAATQGVRHAPAEAAVPQTSVDGASALRIAATPRADTDDEKDDLPWDDEPTDRWDEPEEDPQLAAGEDDGYAYDEDDSGERATWDDLESDEDAQLEDGYEDEEEFDDEEEDEYEEEEEDGEAEDAEDLEQEEEEEAELDEYEDDEYEEDEEGDEDDDEEEVEYEEDEYEEEDEDEEYEYEEDELEPA